MITLYSGTPGSGKSLHLAEKLYYRVKNYNGVVIGNFTFNTNLIKGRHKGKYLSIDNDRLTPKRLEKFSRDFRNHYYKGKPLPEGKFLLVIDECQIMFNSREWQMSGRSEWLTFFTQHRKLGFDIILISQFDRMIDRQIRSLIEYELIHRKVNNYGAAGKVLGLLSGGSLFVSVKMWYPMKERLGAEFFIGKKKYFNMYDTYKMFETAKG
ncbi:zonular occludens toxin Zot [Kineothrix alysoides]|uniref:Zonular occludens toxin Zot n=1 Tax=Kineothrix alysoides TaxID=1469948 RepID=A0A4R1R3M2_9FIRM|nr:zonular occludens toxin domain-containing protein [Kineothrix alysoides]TCL59978.1 zonular occludens toxin Zot [Kineothrix alysoides]